MTLREYYAMTTEAWKLFKRYYGEVMADITVLENDDWWQRLIADGSALAEKYGECGFIKSLVIHNIFDEFDSIWKERSAVA